MSTAANTQTQTETETEEDAALAQQLAAELTVQELRTWMSENGLTRSRGARKLESARQAVEQDAKLVADFTAAECEVECPHCDYVDTLATAGEAEDAARKHKSENPAHFPVALDAEGEAVYGR